VLPRRFVLIRHIDYTGVSGIGVVAYGVTFADGQVVLRWCSNHPATSMWNSMDDMLAVHGHGEATSVEWIDAPHGDLEGFPGPGGGRRGRRRANRTAVLGGGPADDEKSSSPPELPPKPVDSDTTSVSAPAGDGAGHADAGRGPAGGPTDGPAGGPPGGPAGGPAGGPPDGQADGPIDGPAHIPADVPKDQRADTTGPHSDDHAPDAAPSPHEPPTPTAPASDAPTQRRERTFLRSVRSDSEPPTAPLLTSTDTDKRNGHLYIDTAPLLLTFHDSEDEPAQERSQTRRAGRHRRVDPDAAG
jgi:hypothetical protein